MITYLFIFLSLIGLFDASFLTYQHFNADPFACPLFGGCDAVTSSSYSEIAGIPVALLGAIFYAVILAGTLIYYFTEKKVIFHITCHLTVIGLLASVYFLVLMLFVIQALCFYCLISCITSTTLFIAGYLHLKKTGAFLKFV